MEHPRDLSPPGPTLSGGGNLNRYSAGPDSVREKPQGFLAGSWTDEGRADPPAPDC